jgi:hypothetical protein
MSSLKVQTTDNFAITFTELSIEESLYDELCKKDYFITELTHYCELIKSQVPAEFSEGVIALRKLLSSIINPPIYKVFEAGSVEILLTKVKSCSYMLMLEILCIFTNVATKFEPAKFLLENGILSIIENFIKGQIMIKIDLLNHLVLFLANLAMGEYQCVCVLKNEIILNGLMSCYINQTLPANIKINILITFNNILNATEDGAFNPFTIQEALWLSALIHCCLTILTNCAITDEKSEAFAYSLLILKKLSKAFTNKIFTFISNYNAIKSLFILLTSTKLNEFEILTILRILGLFIVNPNYAAIIVNIIRLYILYDVLIKTNNESIKKEIFWLFALILCEPEHIILFLSIPDFLSIIFEEFSNNYTYNVKKLLVCCIMNITAIKKVEVVNMLCDKGILSIIEIILSGDDTYLIEVCLGGLENITATFALDVEKNLKRTFNDIRKSNIVALIENLLLKGEGVYSERIYKLLNTKFYGLSLNDPNSSNERE